MNNEINFGDSGTIDSNSEIVGKIYDIAGINPDPEAGSRWMWSPAFEVPVILVVVTSLALMASLIVFALLFVKGKKELAREKAEGANPYQKTGREHIFAAKEFLTMSVIIILVLFIMIATSSSMRAAHLIEMNAPEAMEPVAQQMIDDYKDVIDRELEKDKLTVYCDDENNREHFYCGGDVLKSGKLLARGDLLDANINTYVDFSSKRNSITMKKINMGNKDLDFSLTLRGEIYADDSWKHSEK